MKKQILEKLRTTIFIILILSAFAFILPMHNKFSKAADVLTQKLLNLVEEQTKLVISYESLSPSILSTLNVKGIKVSTSDDVYLGQINSAKISYKLTKLLKLDIKDGISSVVIDGIDLEIDNLVNFINSFDFEEVDFQEFDVSIIKTFIPSNVKIKNVDLSYSDKFVNTGLFVKDISLTNTHKDYLNFTINSKGNIDIYPISESIKGNIDFTGTLYKDLNNSNVTVKLTDLSDDKVTLNKLCLLVNYNEKVFEAHTIQTVNPIYIEADFDLSDLSGNAILKTENIGLLSLVSLNKNSKELKKFKNVLVDTDSKFSFKVNTTKDISGKVTAEPVFNYKSKGNIFVPDVLFPGSASIVYDVSGNQNKIDIKKIQIGGDKCFADAELSLDYRNLQLSGLVEIPFVILPNGKSVSTELYFDPLDKGFMAFSPQVFIGDKALTAIQLSLIPQNDSFDFMLEAYDYSHASEGVPGNIKIDGSYLTASKYVQANIACNSLYLDSILEFGIEGIDKEIGNQLAGIAENVSPYIFSADTYISTDLKSISYSVPYILIANTKEDNQVLMLTANGNEQSIQLDQLSLVYGKYALQAAASLDIEESSKDMFYTVDLSFSSIPYHFSGNIMKNMVTLSGDYGIDAQATFNKASKTVNGYAMVENLPFTIGEESFIFTINSEFGYDTENGPVVKLSRISLENVSSDYTVSPKVIASGNVTKYGAQIDSITYTDFFSTLEGTADVMVNINEGLFDSVGLVMNIKNPRSEESIVIDANVSNPELVELNSSTLMSSIYLSSQIQIHDFNLNRFTKIHNDHNLLSASLFATGTVEHPYVALTVENINMLMSTDFWNLSGIAILEDKNVSIQNFCMSAPGMLLKDINADLSLESFTGKASALFKTGAGDFDLLVPLNLTIQDTVMPQDGFLPKAMNGKVEVSNVAGGLIRKPLDLSVDLFYADKVLSFVSNEILGAFGSFDFSKNKLMVSADNKDFLKLNLNGNFNEENLELKFSDLEVDLKKVFEYLNFENFVKVKGGTVKGNFAIKDSFDDPNYKGAIVVTNPVVNIPTVFKEDLSTDKILITAINNVIQVLDNNYNLAGYKKIQAGCELFFNKWEVDHIEIKAKSYGKESIPLALDLSFLKLFGDVMCDINMNYQTDKNVIKIIGKVFGENVNVTSKIKDLSQNLNVSDKNSDVEVAVYTNLDISLGTHVALIFDPILRAVFVPNTKIKLLVDSEAGEYKVDGALNLKSGDVAYLNRSFYIKSGSIKFNPMDLANPLITLRAETRERDEKGNNVKIILSAENQYLLSLAPRFTSEPAKSEIEIQQLLGQILTADSTKASSFLMAASDYALQSVLFRKSENKLREFLNFDIFSLRTNVLQNTINLNNTEFSDSNNILGNLLDNSTVYIGKYIGSNLYLDAMIQFSFEDSLRRNIANPGALAFQPEFGMELESPFGNIRWNMAPDINALLHNQFVPSTSVSLSWKFAF